MSPLARGLRYLGSRLQGRGGIIPARAGFTNQENPSSPPRRDHPRSRGVYTFRPPSPLSIPGSSPLARGLLLDDDLLGAISRIIPARAGFTAAREASAGHSSDHPRSRGVYPDGGCLMGQIKGSSPLARGLLPTRYQPNLADRIIPARTGFTIFAKCPKMPKRDHPRSRGVYAPPPIP